MVQEGSNIIGRSNEADFRLPDTGVSRKHAEITWDGRDAILVDLQSTNGTAVNDMPIENWLLADGDVIAIGHSYIEVRIVEDLINFIYFSFLGGTEKPWTLLYCLHSA